MQRPAFSIYDASAGSGKTYALVREYLKIILSAKTNDAYRNILAITFTNKAVHEMKSRIVTGLSEFAKEQPSAKASVMLRDIASQTGLSPEEIREKSKDIIRHIIHNYAAFDISTIDKFTHRVIRTFAHDLNLPVTFEVSLDTENLLAEAVDALIAQAGEDETLTRLLVDFTMEKTDDDKSWDVTREIMETGRLILNENNRNEIGHFKDKSIPEFIAIRDKLNDACRGLEDECVEFALQAIALIGQKGIEHKSFSGEYFPKHLHGISQRKYNPKNKRYFIAEDIKINKTAADRDAIESILSELLSFTADIYKKFEKRDFYGAFLRNITPLSLLNTVSLELDKIQKAQNILSISEFNKKINDEIRNQPAPFIYERLGERYRHFFIDEFQDTSEMQWQNLIPLIDNAIASEDLSGERGSLMIVGDPKQSIYRWRGGKAEQFIGLSKDHKPFANFTREVFTLDTNYRSYSEVIDFNNDFFRFLSGRFSHPDYSDLYENHSRQNTNEKTGGYVNISFISEVSDDDEENPDKASLYVKAVGRTISEVIAKGFEYRDIVILTRKRDHGIAVAKYLTAESIPMISSETLLIANATEVRFIINVLRYLGNAHHAEAKAGFLQFLGNKPDTGMPLHDFIVAGMGRNEAELESWLETFGISFSFVNVRKKSLYDAAEQIVARLVRPTESNAYLQYFLDLVLERDLKGQAGIADFLEFWDKNGSQFSIPSPEGSDAVRIMTIHKSKGLEFPVVIFPFAEEDYSRKPKDKLWLDADADDIGLSKVLIDNSAAIENFGESAAAVFSQKKQEELLDNINVLYVALTRAEEQLYIISAMNLNKNGEPPANSLSSFLITYLENLRQFDPKTTEYSFGDPVKLSPENAKPEDLKVIPFLSEMLPAENIRIAQRESLMWGTHQQEAIEYGNVVHEIMSFVKVVADIEDAVEIAIENGIITPGQRDTVRRTIADIVRHEELRSFFDGNCTVLNEQTIIIQGSPVIKPDRIVIKGSDEAMLLDYKTGAHQPKHVRQLENYANALREMGFRVTKKTLVYIGKEVNVVNL
jgi:ATP-dependent exoDNAse (exonuclease V) beta subunit